MARWVFRCPECRTRRQDYRLLLQHIQTSGHSVCKCNGYHHNHRKGSRYCHHNPLAVLFHADRQGAGDEDLATIAARIVEEQPELKDQVQEACSVLRLSTPLQENHGNQEL